MRANPFPYLVVLNQFVPALEQGEEVEVVRLANDFQHFINDVVVPQKVDAIRIRDGFERVLRRNKHFNQGFLHVLGERCLFRGVDQAQDIVDVFVILGESTSLEE